MLRKFARTETQGRATCFVLRKFSENVLDIESLVETLGSNPSKKKGKRTNALSTLCSPPLDVNQSKEISSIVAINMKVDAISWARMCKDKNNVTHWNIQNLPADIAKSDPIKMHQLAQSIYKNLPKGDLYVMDQLKTRVGSKNPAASTAFITKLQLLSMLISMINLPHNGFQESDAEEENAMYATKIVLLRPLLVVKFFNLLIGDEQVSVKSVVEKVLKNEWCKTHYPLKIDVDPLKGYQSCRSNIDKENLGLALLMSVTFMELILHKNPGSLKILMKSFEK